MAENKKAQKPSGPVENAKVAEGQEKAPASSDVSGHMSPGAYYDCWHCLRVNYVPYGWEYFYCRHCYALNRV